MSEYLYLVQLDIPDEKEDDFNRIYDTQHVPYILEVPGVESCTRYKLENCEVGNVPRYVALYEIDSPNLPTSDAWQEASDKGDWVTQIRPHTTNRAREVFKRIT